MNRNILRCNFNRGSISVMLAVSSFFILACAAISTDVGWMYYNQRLLQAAVDSAATAGAQKLYTSTMATVTSNVNLYAAKYSGGVTSYNTLPSNVTVNQPTITWHQYNSVPLTYTTPPNVSGYNAIDVNQTATVPLYFGRLLGKNSVSIAATASASAGGGSSVSVNVAIILDTTGSMSTADSKCGSVPGVSGTPTRLQCAKYGAQVLLQQLTAAGDNVSLFVFPPASSNYPSNPTCSFYTSLSSANYANTGVFDQITSFVSSSSYWNSSGKTLSTSSILSLALGVQNSNCSGLNNPGGRGTYLAETIVSAQKAFPNNSQQNVIILLTDGAANSGNVNSSYVLTSGAANNQCQQTVSAANYAKSAGTLVYVIAYGATNIQSDCSSDTAAITSNLATGFKGVSIGTTITPCIELYTAAGNVGTSGTIGSGSNLSTYFYSDNANGCAASPSNTASSVSTLFQSIGEALQSSRLIPTPSSTIVIN